MKILITGSGGFIGSRLAANLLEKNYVVTGLIHEQKIDNSSIKTIYADLTEPNFTIPDEMYD
ncbi:MAG: NAD-dependent epimerase/dehydratase family protein, partial [Nitrosopumilaceae archaeon]